MWTSGGENKDCVVECVALYVHMIDHNVSILIQSTDSTNTQHY